MRASRGMGDMSAAKKKAVGMAKGGKVMPPGKFAKGNFPWEEGMGKNYGTLHAKKPAKIGKSPPSKTLRK